MRRPRLAIAVLMTLMVTACVRPPAAAPSCGPIPSHSPIPPMVDAPDDEGAQEVQAYGAAHPDEFAGVYFDRENGGRLVARFTACIELHQAALDALLGSRDHV